MNSNKRFENGKSHLREIPSREMKAWKSQKQSLVLKILRTFLRSNMKMAEVKLDDLPEPQHRRGVRSTKQDSFASSFYAWKKKKSTQQELRRKNIEILLIRRGGRIALKKVKREISSPKSRGS